MEDYKVYFVQYYYGPDGSYDRYGSWVIAKDEKELLIKLTIKHACNIKLITIRSIDVCLSLEDFIIKTNGLFNDDEILDAVYKISQERINYLEDKVRELEYFKNNINSAVSDVIEKAVKLCRED